MIGAVQGDGVGTGTGGANGIEKLRHKCEEAEQAARAAFRSKMERECQEGCLLQINEHNAARAAAKAEALRLKEAMTEQAREM